MIRLFIIVLFLAVLFVFTASNTDPVQMWMVSFGWKISVGWFAAGLAVFSLFIGLLTGWMGEFRQMRARRRADNKVRTLEKQVVELHQRLDRAQSHSPVAAMQAAENAAGEG